MSLQSFNPLRWRKSFLLLVLVAVTVVWVAFFDTYSIHTRISMAQQKADLEAEIERMNAAIDQLDQNIDELNGDPALLEKIAREEYGMRKPGETVYRIRSKE
jgi:cell division protein FtsB